MGIPSETVNGKADWSKALNSLNGGHDADSYFGQLRNACFDAWLKVDPTLAHDQIESADRARCRDLAKTIAAVCHLYLTNCWDKRRVNLRPITPFTSKI